MLAHKRDRIENRGQRGAFAFRVIVNQRAGFNGRAGGRAPAGISCAHGADHAAPPNMRAHALSYISRPLSDSESTDSMGEGLK